MNVESSTFAFEAVDKLTVLEAQARLQISLSTVSRLDTHMPNLLKLTRARYLRTHSYTANLRVSIDRANLVKYRETLINHLRYVPINYQIK